MMIYKCLLVASALIAAVSAQEGRNAGPGQLFDLFKQTLEARGGTYSRKGQEILQAMKSDFPDLTFSKDNAYPSVDYDVRQSSQDEQEEEEEEEESAEDGDEQIEEEEEQYYKDREDIREKVFTMMETIFHIMKIQGLITETDEPVGNLINSGFALLADYIRRQSLNSKFGGSGCPYSYDEKGSLCLSTDFSAQGMTWSEARLYCQIVKGGDLAIFKDANDLQDMISYVRKYDVNREHAYWIGASRDDYDFSTWWFINGESVPLGTPYWGSKITGEEQNPSKDNNYNFAFLDNFDHYYVGETDFDNAISTVHKTVPLCQYYHGRGHDAQRYHADRFYHEDAGDVSPHFAEILKQAAKYKNKKYDTPTVG